MADPVKLSWVAEEAVAVALQELRGRQIRVEAAAPAARRAAQAS